MSDRDRSVDILRGVAISAMVWGHLGMLIYAPGGGPDSSVFPAAPPLWAEVVGGLAPPLFVLIAGMMVAYTVRVKGYGLAHLAKRGAVLVLLAAAIDLVYWRILPFTTMDILYTLGVALPLAYLFATRVSNALGWALVAAVFLATPPLQELVGYAEYPLEFSLSGRPTAGAAGGAALLRSWLVDGWFPLFPWIGFAFLGVLLARLRWPAPGQRRRFGRVGGLGAGLACLAAAAGLGWPDAADRLFGRLQYGGAFMPPDLAYILACVGLMLALFYIIDRTVDRRLPALAYRPFEILGQLALAVYVFHFPVAFALDRLIPGRLSAWVFIPFFFALVLAAAGAIGLARRLALRLQPGVVAEVEAGTSRP